MSATPDLGHRPDETRLHRHDRELELADLLDRQVHRLVTRHSVSRALAMLIAEIAFSSGRQP